MRTATATTDADGSATLAVLGNRRFLALWLAQVATQVGGNMVLYGLTVQIFRLTRSSTSVSLLILSFLVPAVIFSAVAGVYVDRLDRRLMLVATNVLRGAVFLLMAVFDSQLALIYLLTVLVSTATTFFAPAEAAMIPLLVDRRHLLAANGIFTFTLQASFALGFALLGPLLVNLAGVTALLVLVALLYLGAGALCWVLPPSKPSKEGFDPAQAIGQMEAAVGTMFRQLREGLAYTRVPNIFWALTYLGITASLIGVLGVLGPDFATRVLGLRETDFVVVVLPLGAGLVIGILLLTVYGKYFPRRRVIEVALLAMAVLLAILALAPRITYFLQRGADATGLELGALLSLLSVVVLLALAIGITYGMVAVASQTQLQEELPGDVRGRVFGVLNMLVSIASFLPIIVVGPVADLIGTPLVILLCAAAVAVAAVGSILRAGALTAGMAEPGAGRTIVDPVSVTTAPIAAGSSERLPSAWMDPERPEQPAEPGARGAGRGGDGPVVSRPVDGGGR